MVGICGIGGLGKTTIARALYNSIADNFEGLCFVHDVKEKSKKLGLEGIQEIILSKILGVDIKIADVKEGVQVIKKRFKEKKILLILDNVENNGQLKNLAGCCDWFGAESRIIITTRDEQLLVAHRVESRYDMEVFNTEESLELLNWIAFRNPQVDPCYKDVLNRAITYAQGLPLALEVIGSNLCGKTIDEWESALDAYKSSLPKGIHEVLRMSYDILEEVEKEIFLDIACLFNGEHSEYVKYMVEAVHDFENLSSHFGVLVNKRLIKIEKWCNHIQMHDLIREMGRKIVCEESPNNPGERSRLWFYQDIVEVLECNTGTNKVRMIVQDNWRECIKVDWDEEAFKNMKGLKILIFVNVKFSEVPKYLPKSLKVLKWRGYPSSCFPPNFSPKKLVFLDVELSYLSSLEAIKTSDNLDSLNLEGCKYVKEIPDLSNLIKLKKLRLKDCKNLIGIHDLVGYLPKLESLEVGGCVRLKTFPRAIKLPSLSNLGLFGCSSLKHFPEILDKGKLRALYLYETGIQKLPWSICNLSELRVFKNYQIKSVIEIPDSIFLLPKIEDIELSRAIIDRKVISCNSKEGQEHAIWSKQCPYGSISLTRCKISDDVLRTDLSRFRNVLRFLTLSGSDFTILPASIKECHFLMRLWLKDCKHLREVEGIPPSITRLEARNCVSLSLESKSLILSEGLHGAPVRYYSSENEEPCDFWVPGRSIPKWFDHRSKGPSISFWFRNSFPPLCLCLLLKPADVVSKFYAVDVRVDINEEPAFHYGLEDLLYSVGDHLYVFSLSKNQIPIIEDGWNHAQVFMLYGSDEGSVIEEIGMYVIKQLCDMEDITFRNPYHQTLDSTWGDQEQVDARMEKKEVALDRKRGLMGDGNFTSVSLYFLRFVKYLIYMVSIAFTCTKRARNSPVNQDDNDAITPQVPFVKALEIINNIPGSSLIARGRTCMRQKVPQNARDS